MKSELDFVKSIIEMKLNKKELKDAFDRINGCKDPRAILVIYDRKDKSIVSKLKKMGLLK